MVYDTVMPSPSVQVISGFCTPAPRSSKGCPELCGTEQVSRQPTALSQTHRALPTKQHCLGLTSNQTCGTDPFLGHRLVDVVTGKYSSQHLTLIWVMLSQQGVCGFPQCQPTPSWLACISWTSKWKDINMLGFSLKRLISSQFYLLKMIFWRSNCYFEMERIDIFRIGLELRHSPAARPQLQPIPLPLLLPQENVVQLNSLWYFSCAENVWNGFLDSSCDKKWQTFKKPVAFQDLLSRWPQLSQAVGHIVSHLQEADFQFPPGFSK